MSIEDRVMRTRARVHFYYFRETDRDPQFPNYYNIEAERPNKFMNIECAMKILNNKIILLFQNECNYLAVTKLVTLVQASKPSKQNVTLFYAYPLQKPPQERTIGHCWEEGRAVQVFNPFIFTKGIVYSQLVSHYTFLAGR